MYKNRCCFQTWLKCLNFSSSDALRLGRSVWTSVRKNFQIWKMFKDFSMLNIFRLRETYSSKFFTKILMSAIRVYQFTCSSVALVSLRSVNTWALLASAAKVCWLADASRASRSSTDDSKIRSFWRSSADSDCKYSSRSLWSFLSHFVLLSSSEKNVWHC